MHNSKLAETTLSELFLSEGGISSYENVMKALTRESSGRKSMKRKVFYCIPSYWFILNGKLIVTFSQAREIVPSDSLILFTLYSKCSVISVEIVGLTLNRITSSFSS